jgi:prepilin signal peptidase PulO-like enzyme (type II secretory pathway)
MIPFGPFMLAGAFLAVFWGEILAQAYLDQLGL